MSRVFEELTSRLTDGRVYLKREPGHVESVKGYLLDTDLLACADLDARKLREKEEQKWELLTKFWVEILTHVAALCNGTSHAQQLRKGGEFLTHIWFLIEHLDLKRKISNATSSSTSGRRRDTGAKSSSTFGRRDTSRVDSGSTYLCIVSYYQLVTTYLS